MAVAELSASVPGQRKRAQPGSGFSWAPPLPDPRGSSGARTASHSCSDWRHGGGLTSDSHWLWAAPGRREKPPPRQNPPISREGGSHEQETFSREEAGGSRWQPIPEAGGRRMSWPRKAGGWWGWGSAPSFILFCSIFNFLKSSVEIVY